jgi:hypothetical protein
MKLTLPADRLKSRKIAFAQVSPCRRLDVFFGDQEKIHRIYQQILVPSEQCSHSASDLVALDGVPDFLAGDNGHPGMAEPVGKIDQVKIFSSGTDAAFVKIVKIFLLADPLERTIAFYHQTARRFRPFCLLLLMTFCPPLVLMRTRNPWSFFLFLLFGRNVGFIILGPLRVVCY